MYTILFVSVSISLFLIGVVLVCVYAYVQTCINKIKNSITSSLPSTIPLEYYPIQINLKTMNSAKYHTTNILTGYNMLYAYSLINQGIESQKTIINLPEFDISTGYGYEFYTLDKFPENYSINLYRLIYTSDKNYGFELVQSTPDFTKIEDTKIKLPFN